MNVLDVEPTWKSMSAVTGVPVSMLATSNPFRVHDAVTPHDRRRGAWHVVLREVRTNDTLERLEW